MINTRSYKYFISCGWLTLLVVFSARADELSDIVRTGIKSSWEIENSRFDATRVEDDYQNSWKSTLPSLNATTKHGFQGGDTDPRSSRLSEYALEAKSNLLLLSQWDAFKATKHARNAQSLRVDERINKYCLDLSNLYFAYLVQRKQSQTTLNILEILSKQFDITASEYRQGLKPRKDYLRLRAELRNVEIEQLSQSIDLKNAENKLREKIGEEFNRFSFNPSLLAIPEMKNVEENTPDSVLELSLKEELLSLKDRRTQLKHDLWPKLNLIANYRISDSNFWKGSSYNPGSNALWGVALGLEYTIWDWGVKSRVSEIESLKTRVRENEALQEIRVAQNALDSSRQKLLVSRRVYTARTQALGDERESFGIISRDYREGRINFLDYVSSLRSFGAAEQSTFEGLVQVIRSYFEVLLHRGELDDYFQ